MDYIEQARACLERAVDELTKCGSSAFSDRKIDESARIGTWIKVIQGLYSETAGKSVDLLPVATAPVARVPVAGKSGRLSRGGKADYPRFHRDRDGLVKVGWSKKEREEYEHKAPKGAVEATAAAIAQVGAGGREFTANDLLAQAAVAGLPQYQVYLVLAWFRSIGLVEQMGKQGYACANSDCLRDSVSERWQELAESR